MRAHDMLPENSHDEQAMQDFVRTFRRFLRTDVMPGAREVFDNKVEPEFRESNGRSFANYHEVRKAMTNNDFYQLWSAMQRRSQELLWESVIAPTERQLNELIDQFNSFAVRQAASGSLRLDADLEIPRYHTAVDIHLQPGGYHTDVAADDVAAGVLYEAGLPIYIDGELGPLSDGIGAALLGFCKASYPDFSPRRILDMGCAVGNSTLPWVNEFPDCEVYAIDVGAPCLRFAHARAESLGAKVYFSQQNAECTNFDDGFFDLVISHIVLHETSKPALRNVIAETHRLLRPGGMMMHLDIPRGEGAFEQFMSQWETYNNNEVFSAYMTDVDLPALAVDVGFAQGDVHMAGARPDNGVHHAYNESGFAWPVLVGTK